MAKSLPHIPAWKTSRTDCIVRPRHLAELAENSPTASFSPATSCSWIWPRSRGTATILLLPHPSCVGKEPSQEQKDSLRYGLQCCTIRSALMKVGAITRDIAMKWPSAMEHLGLRRTKTRPPPISWASPGARPCAIRPPVISRITGRSMHPIEQSGRQDFALRNPARQTLRTAFAFEEMLDRCTRTRSKSSRIFLRSSRSPVVIPIPGYGDHVK